MHAKRFVSLLAIPWTAIDASKPGHHDRERRKLYRRAATERRAVRGGQSIRGMRRSRCDVGAGAREFDYPRRTWIGNERPAFFVGRRIVVKSTRTNTGRPQSFC
jgi:hypothetical protein